MTLMGQLRNKQIKVDEMKKIMEVSGGYDEAIKRYSEAQRRGAQQEIIKVKEMIRDSKDYIKGNQLEINRSPEFIRDTKSPAKKIIPQPIT